MTDEIADSIITWVRTESENTRRPRPNGADSSYYNALSPSYRCKNGPLDSVEELLYVRGVTSQLLFGTDHNRNGVQDPGEDDGSGWDPGWAAYLTVYSRFPNVDSEGKTRVALNGTISQTYYDNLKAAVGQQLADFMILSSQSSGLQVPAADANKSRDEKIQG